MAQQQFLARVVPLITELMDRVPSPTGADGLLVGLSGGPDSVALLLAAHHWSGQSGRPLAAAHLNHRLRGSQADEDEAFCQELCRRLDLPLHLRREDPRPVARQRGTGLEDAARILRRRFFGNLLGQPSGLRCVATGHHRDDQAETVIMRFFRGTGLDGLRGIQPVSGTFIHPLLGCSREEILAFLEAEGQPYRIDASNTQGDNLRSRVRLELAPLLREIFGPAAASTPVRLAELVEDDLTLLEQLTSAAVAELVTEDGIDIAGLLALDRSLARRVLRCFLAPAGSPADLERKHVEMIMDWLPDSVSGQRLDLAAGLCVVREFARLRREAREILDRPVSSAETFRILVEPTPWPPAAGAPPPPGDDDASRLICPAQALRGHLRIRNWQPGDRIEVRGLGGHKKLSDLLQERRVPRASRAGALVVEDDLGILWVVGHARAARTRMLPGTAQAVTISVVSRDQV